MSHRPRFSFPPPPALTSPRESALGGVYGEPGRLPSSLRSLPVWTAPPFAHSSVQMAWYAALPHVSPLRIFHFSSGRVRPPTSYPYCAARPRRSGEEARLSREAQGRALHGKHLRLKPARFWRLVWDPRPGWAALKPKNRLNVVGIVRRRPDLDIAGCIRSGRLGISPDVEARQREPQYRVRTRRGSGRTCEKDEAEHQESAVATFGLVS